MMLPPKIRKVSREMRAVLTIFNADEELKRKTLAFVDIERGTVDWDGIWSHDYGSGHRIVVLWAEAVWKDSSPPVTDLFHRAFAMGDVLRRSVLKALGIRWGLID